MIAHVADTLKTNQTREKWMHNQNMTHISLLAIDSMLRTIHNSRHFSNAIRLRGNDYMSVTTLIQTLMNWHINLTSRVDFNKHKHNILNSLLFSHIGIDWVIEISVKFKEYLSYIVNIMIADHLAPCVSAATALF